MLCNTEKIEKIKYIQDYNKIIVQTNFVHRFQSPIHANKLNKSLIFIWQQYMYFKFYRYFMYKTHTHVVCVFVVSK